MKIYLYVRGKTSWRIHGHLSMKRQLPTCVLHARGTTCVGREKNTQLVVLFLRFESPLSYFL